jgi:radical SAM protein with 4Fe4S-binding SPASM domain
VYDILDQAKDIEMPGGKIWMISFNGLGEPLLYKDIDKAVAYAKKLYPYVGFITNGYLLDEDLSRRLLEVDMDYICFSVNAVSVDVYKHFQGYGFKDDETTQKILERVLGNINTFLRLRKELNKQTEVRISYILTEDSEAHLKEFVKYWKKTGYEIMLPITKLITWTKSEGVKYTRCERITEDFMINANGDVSICACDHLHGAVVGNVFEKPLKDIMLGEKFASILKAHETMDLENIPKVCLECEKLMDYGFLQNHSTGFKTLYVNNRMKSIKWFIYTNGLNIFTELKKHPSTFAFWRKVKKYMMHKETANRSAIRE